MARKNRNLASFENVASVNTNINDVVNNTNEVNENDKNIINDNNDVDNTFNINDNVNNDIKLIKEIVTDSDYLDELLEGSKKKGPETVLMGIYFPKEIGEILNKLGKKGGRGAKSKIVSDAVRKVFEEKGLL